MASIAFDSSANSSSASFSFNNAAGNFLVLVVGSNANTAFTATYNGVSLTSQGNQKMDTQNNWIQVLTLMSPATGSHTLAISGTGFLQASVATYSGVNTSSEPEVTKSTATASALSTSQSITTLRDNSWSICAFGANAAPTSYSNATARASNLFPYLADSNGVVHPAGSYTQGATCSGTTPWANFQIVIGTNQAFTQSLTGTLSFTGAIAKKTSHALTSAALSFTGTVARRAGKVLTGALSFSGAIARVDKKVLTGVLSFSGAIARTVAHGLTATLSFSGGLARRVGHALTASLSLSGSVARRVSHALTAALSFSGSVSTKTTHTKSLTGGLSFSGNFSKGQHKVLTAALSFTGTFTALKDVVHLIKQLVINLVRPAAIPLSVMTHKLISLSLQRPVDHNAALSKHTDTSKLTKPGPVDTPMQKPTDISVKLEV